MKFFLIYLKVKILNIFTKFSKICTIFDLDGNIVNRPILNSKMKLGQADKGNFNHFMQKEIFEQPQAIRDTLESRITNDSVITSSFGLIVAIIAL